MLKHTVRDNTPDDWLTWAAQKDWLDCLTHLLFTTNNRKCSTVCWRKTFSTSSPIRRFTTGLSTSDATDWRSRAVATPTRSNAASKRWAMICFKVRTVRTMRSSCTSTYSSHCFNQSYFEVVVEIKEIDFVMCVNIVCAMLSSLLWSIVYLPVLHVYVWPYSSTKSRLHCVHACCSSELAFTAID